MYKSFSYFLWFQFCISISESLLWRPLSFVRLSYFGSREPEASLISKLDDPLPDLTPSHSSWAQTLRASKHKYKHKHTSCCTTTTNTHTAGISTLALKLPQVPQGDARTNKRWIRGRGPSKKFQISVGEGESGLKWAPGSKCNYPARVIHQKCRSPLVLMKLCCCCCWWVRFSKGLFSQGNGTGEAPSSFRLFFFWRYGYDRRQARWYLQLYSYPYINSEKEIPSKKKGKRLSQRGLISVFPVQL